MTHLTEQDLVLHYYGELAGSDEGKATKHLADCAACRREFTQLQRVLGALDETVLAPELPDGFERTVWARLEPNLRPEPRGWFSWLMVSPVPLAISAILVVAVITAAFFAGRVSSPRTAPAAAAVVSSSEQVRERIFLVDLGEHLDRTQMVLVELVAADPERPLDVTGERAHAEQLLAANRLYRETAMSTGNAAMSDLLDELERILVELAAGPGTLTPPQLDVVRKQIESQSLLFRVRIVSSVVRERQKEAIQRRAGQRL
jgi:hypothetical protein